MAATLHFLQNKSFISMATMGEGAGKTMLLRIITADGKLLVAGDDVNSNFLLCDSDAVTPLLLVVSLLTANTHVKLHCPKSSNTLQPSFRGNPHEVTGQVFS